MTPQTDPFEGLTAEEEMRLEREAIQAEGPPKPTMGSATREWVAVIEGGTTFDLRQICEDIGARSQKDRDAVRYALHRLKGRNPRRLLR